MKFTDLRKTVMFGKFFRKKIEKLDNSVSRNVQIIATMRHEMDILNAHRASYKGIETENAELKSKLDLLLSIESILSASQHEIDEILKQKISAKDLAVMVGTLRRELNNNEIRKNLVRKQLQTIKNDLRAEQEEKRELKEKLSFYESENHMMKNKLRKMDRYETEEKVEVDGAIDSFEPESAKRPRLAPKLLNDLNTSAISPDEFRNRVDEVKESDSPYLRVKSSSIALACVLKKPLQMKKGFESKSNFGKEKPKVATMSIFNKPRLPMSGPMQAHKSEMVVYDGIGGRMKVLQSDLKMDNFSEKLHSSVNGANKKKKSPNALNNPN